MDRRQRKTRQAVFSAFTELLSKKKCSDITVGEIIEKAQMQNSCIRAFLCYNGVISYREE